jgi:hypothetical protein
MIGTSGALRVDDARRDTVEHDDTCGARLGRGLALVPRPRVNLIRSYGVFAPNSRFRARVTPAGGKGRTAAGGAPTFAANDNNDGATPAQRMTWAQRLRRVFRMPQGTFSWCCAPIHLVDVETCPKCGGTVKIMPKALAALAGHALACIDEEEVMPIKRGRPWRRSSDCWPKEFLNLAPPRSHRPPRGKRRQGASNLLRDDGACVIGVSLRTPHP